MPDQPDRDSPVLVPGETCWRIEHADRLAFIVDAADYFYAIKQSILKARHSILLIGWDFDTRIKLEPGGKTLEGPNRLGRLLSWVVKHRPGLRIYVLKWDLGILQTFGRGTTPLFILDWMTSKRIRFKLDGHHPPASAHHQKIAVIDDCIAFCGGIDMTDDRWDTREHRDKDDRRRRPSGFRSGPWHDATTAVDGDAARALGELARERWRRATGETIEPAPMGNEAWPDSLEPTLRRVDVAIARTFPLMEDQEEVREIEALYLAAIASARRTIYMESQYFAARRIAEAIAARLREPDGPDIVLINPESAEGWLEALTMNSARAKLLKMVRRADRHGRFRIFYPQTEGGKPIYVHAKIMAIDDRLFRVGSSNLNNRSMGFDSECDLALEAGPDGTDGAELRRTIVALRNDLLAEHLGVPAERVAAAIEQSGGSLVAAVDGLIGPGRSLVPYEPPAELDAIEEAMAENEFLDPEGAPSFWRRVTGRAGHMLRRAS